MKYLDSKSILPSTSHDPSMKADSLEKGLTRNSSPFVTTSKLPNRAEVHRVVARMTTTMPTTGRSIRSDGRMVIEVVVSSNHEFVRVRGST